MWIPELSKYGGARYLAIVEAIAEDIERGRLKPGTQMPTHRELASKINVTIGTVTRAYAEAARRGLLVGETGRGTFVKESLFDDALPGFTPTEDDGLIDLSLNIPPLPVGDPLGQALAKTLKGLAGRQGLSALMAYQPAAGALRHRAAGAALITRSGLVARTEQIIVCSGALHAMTVVFSTLCKPGDTILTESLTYPGMKNLAHLLNLRLQGVPVDEQGLVPAAFDEACRSGAAKVLYTIPTIQNPLGTVMPEERRREIAAIAQAHDVAIVEDDVHSFMLPEHLEEYRRRDARRLPISAGEDDRAALDFPAGDGLDGRAAAGGDRGRVDSGWNGGQAGGAEAHGGVCAAGDRESPAFVFRV
jgi:DNA-binding transcriptional MocR family regulator